jgi:hypothetical protein
VTCAAGSVSCLDRDAENLHHGLTLLSLAGRGRRPLGRRLNGGCMMQIYRIML